MSDLLFLTQRIPYPPIKGEKIRPLQILRHFSRDYNVHLGCLIDDPDDWQHVDTVKALCKDAYFAPLDRKRATIMCLRGLLTGQPLSVEFFQNRGLARWINSVLDHVKPEIIFICSSNMAPYAIDHRHKGRVRIVDLADVDSEKWLAYADQGSFPMKWVHAREGRLVRQLERKIARETDYSTFVSEPEAQLFRTILPEFADRILGISSGVDFDYFDGASTLVAPYDASKPTYVFTGTMDYAPNVDAVVWFTNAMLPLIRQTHPAAQFYIVGTNPSPEVQRLTEIQGVYVTGRVPDVRPYVAHATACVAPMRIARGIQNKVLEAMSMGKPAIVTSDALEGIDAVPGRDILLADTAEDFAKIATDLVTSDLGDRIGAAARALVLAHYAWGAKLRALDTLLAPPQTQTQPHHDKDKALAS